MLSLELSGLTGNLCNAPADEFEMALELFENLVLPNGFLTLLSLALGSKPGDPDQVVTLETLKAVRSLL